MVQIEFYYGIIAVLKVGYGQNGKLATPDRENKTINTLQYNTSRHIKLGFFFNKKSSLTYFNTNALTKLLHHVLHEMPPPKQIFHTQVTVCSASRVARFFM